MYYLVNTQSMKNIKIYVAVLEKDCTPHYFLDFRNATDYIWDNLPKEEQYPEHWLTLNSYNEKEQCWLISGYGWIEEVVPEDSTK